MAETPPPLRVREADGSPSLIPTYVMTFSGATLTRRGPTEMLIQMDSGASGGGAPTDSPYITYAADGTLSAERILKAGSSVTVVTDGTSIYVNALTGGGSSVVYAPTGGSYVSFETDASLSNERVLTSGSSITVVTDGAFVYVTAITAGFTTSARTITTLFPLSGGANLSADRTFAVDTAGFLVNSSRTITTLFPLSGGRNLGVDFNIAVDTAFLVNTGRTISFGSGFLVGGGDLSANRTITYSLPIGVGTGGTGATTLTAFGVLYGSGASAIQALTVLSGGSLIVGSGNSVPPFILTTAGQGQYLITSGGLPSGLGWANTLAAGGGPVYAPTGGFYVTYTADASLTAERVLTAGSSVTVVTDGTNIYISAITNAGGGTKTVLLPLALMTVQPDSANAFWMSVTGTNLDYSFVRFVDSGEGIATYWGRVPFNLAATPAWNLRFYSKTGAAAAGTAIVTTRARSITDAEDIDLAYTIVSSAAPYLIRSANLLTISAVSGGNFDSVVGTSAGDLLMVEVNRHGGDTNDVLSNGWDLMGVDMRVDVS